jgi:hypothetical protein
MLGGSWSVGCRTYQLRGEMLNTVQQAEKVIRQRLREIADEAGRLERALTHLAPIAGSGGGKARAGTGRRARPGKRARRGQRADEFIRIVKKYPGATGQTIAAKLGVATSQIYSLAKRLEQQGRIRKSQSGFEVLRED